MIREFLLTAMQFVHNQSGLPMQELPKLVIIETQAKLDKECGSFNAYACEGQRTIFYPAFCDKEFDLECQGGLVHEMYHYLDEMDHGYGKCTEREAYKMEDLYYQKHGSSLKEVGYDDALIKYLTKC